MSTIVDSYSETNRDTESTINAQNHKYHGQTFSGLSTPVVLSSCQFYLKRGASSSATLTAYVYAGSGGVPTGAPLATSDSRSLGDVGTSLSLITFTFSGANKITLNANGDYVLVLYSSGSSPNDVYDGVDNSSPSHHGNCCSSNDGNTWYSGGTNALYPITGNPDICFYVYTDTINHTLTAGTGVFALTGFSASFLRAIKIVCGYGSYTMTGFPAILSVTRVKFHNLVKHIVSWTNKPKN